MNVITSGRRTRVADRKKKIKFFAYRLFDEVVKRQLFEE